MNPRTPSRLPLLLTTFVLAGCSSEDGDTTGSDDPSGGGSAGMGATGGAARSSSGSAGSAAGGTGANPTTIVEPVDVSAYTDEELADLAIRAYQYGYSLVTMEYTRRGQIESSIAGGALDEAQAHNQFVHPPGASTGAPSIRGS